MSTAKEHLEPDAIHWLAEGEGEPQLLERAHAHLAVCEDCQKVFRAHEDTVRRLRGLLTPELLDSECPSVDQLLRLAAGLLGESEANALLDHATLCESCGTTLREAAEDFADEVTAEEEETLGALESATADWKKQVASAVSAPKGNQWWLYAAAAVVAGAGSWVLMVQRGPSLDGLLAKAYTEQRTIELRMTGADHAPLQRERAGERSSLSKPAALLRAEYLIRERLTSGTPGGPLLAFKGRSEILEWQYDAAIASLTSALDRTPGSPDALRDLATAYFQRGEMERRPTDYGLAAEYLGQVLARDPNDEVAVFNRAIVNERLYLYTEAERDWERYLALDPFGEWAQEARERLEELQRILKRGSAAPAIVLDPAKAALLLEARRDWQDSLDEEYLDLAVRVWLPALGSGKPEELLALRALAKALEENHRDSWLSDVLSVRPVPAMGEGWNELARAAVANAEGNHETATEAAARAAQEFEAAGCRTCALHARWELAYALQRRQNGARCRTEAESALEKLSSEGYPWIRSQLLTERAVCAQMVGDMDIARRDSQRAEAVARAADYPTLHLRTLQFAGVEVARQDPERGWVYFREGLKRHWEGVYRPFRAYQFYGEMAYAAESEEKWHLARALAREAVAHIARTPNRLVEAVARHSLAVDAELAGDTEEAKLEFERAREIFSSLPPSSTTATYAFSADVYQASIESQTGRADLALERLRAARRERVDASQYWVWLHFYQTLGEALLQKGDLEGADRALRAALHISEGAFASIQSDVDRLSWERSVSRAYRARVELELARGDAERALEVWEWYRAATARAPGASHPRSPIAFDALQEGPPLPKMAIVSERLPHLKRVTVVSFAQLPSGFTAWMLDDRGIELRRLAIAPEELERTARRFAGLCADPESDLTELRRTGRRLYDWLLAPFEERMEAGRALVVEPDASLSSIPFQALVDFRNEYLGQRVALAYSPGLGFSTARAQPSSTQKGFALIVGTAAAPKGFGSRLIPVAEAESEARVIAKYLPRPRLLLGKEATLARLQRELPGAGVLHFAGHAISTPARKGLLLASDEPEQAAFLDATRFAELDLAGTGLVVLSACRTAADERGLVNPLSLVRAFLVAGVDEVVASRWNVDSASTAELMERFYRILSERRTPTGALRAAADELRARLSTSHPYYWAAFSVYGVGNEKDRS